MNFKTLYYVLVTDKHLYISLFYLMCCLHLRFKKSDGMKIRHYSYIQLIQMVEVLQK